MSIKEASLVLMDACHRPELVEESKKIIGNKYAVEVEEVEMRGAVPRLLE